MKRRITIEVDDALFPKAKLLPAHIEQPERMMCEVELGFLIGPMQAEHQRTVAASMLARHGVTLILDEQID